MSFFYRRYIDGIDSAWRFFFSAAVKCNESFRLKIYFIVKICAEPRSRQKSPHTPTIYGWWRAIPAVVIFCASFPSRLMLDASISHCYHVARWLLPLATPSTVIKTSFPARRTTRGMNFNGSNDKASQWFLPSILLGFLLRGNFRCRGR